MNTVEKMNPQVTIGCRILRDEHRGIVEILMPGDERVDDDWPGCGYRIKTCAEAPECGIPVNIEVTGSKIQWKCGLPMLRARVEYCRDGSENEFGGAYVEVEFP